ncbi:hypothetical protein [Candidatus Uabimicrobium amorphum]|uniref:Uncharacterized protein n=1 Tax=Uabimicrobium amorphum TaxID=2596890 RepID=A0A5S9F6Q2_UABAM|nr:hypothetical protein [Candidatus Uabimicrobium amorphum]BBM87601.1 hypothetical protein UABAM_06013 [Candidatus Uabimicrobium amorphum]
MNKRFLKLQKSLQQPPSEKLWQWTIQHFENWPNTQERQQALSYAQNIIDSWPQELCESRHTDQISVANNLVHSIVLQDTQNIDKLKNFPRVTSIEIKNGTDLRDLSAFCTLQNP